MLTPVYETLHITSEVSVIIVSVALMLFSGVRQKLNTCNVPKVFEGVPITLIAASIVSMTFVGFGGIVEGIFK